jgi:hypothetical protein
MHVGSEPERSSKQDTCSYPTISVFANPRSASHTVPMRSYHKRIPALTLITHAHSNLFTQSPIQFIVPRIELLQCKTKYQICERPGHILLKLMHESVSPLLQLTSLGTCLVQDSESALTATDGITSLDDIARPAVSTAVLDTANYWDGASRGSRDGCGRGGTSWGLHSFIKYLSCCKGRA